SAFCARSLPALGGGYTPSGGRDSPAPSTSALSNDLFRMSNGPSASSPRPSPPGRPRRPLCRAPPGVEPMPRPHDPPRDLLFGLLALQNGMVTRAQLVMAFTAWTATPGKPLADLLAEQGALRPEHRPLLNALADAHIKLHGGDPEKSLAALGV